MNRQPRKFVILTHDHPVLHWDFMLESGDVLKTWRLLEEPVPENCLRGIVAEALLDHRRDYLEYEGPVSEDRGSVTRWDRGVYTIVVETDSKLVVEMNGEVLDGIYEIATVESVDEATSIFRRK